MGLETQIFTWVDWMVVIAIVLFFALGAMHGLSNEIKSLVSWTVAPIIAFIFYADLATISILQFITTAGLRSVISFFILYASIVFVLGVVLSLALKVFMGPLVVFLAGFLALIKWTILFSFITMMADKSLSKEDLRPLHSAYFYSSIQSVSSALFSKAQQGLKVAKEFKESNGINKDGINKNIKGYKQNFDKYKKTFKNINKTVDDVSKYKKSIKKMNDDFDKYLPKNEK